MKTDVSGARNQHDAHVLQLPLDDVHELVQAAGGRLRGVRQESVVEVDAQRLRLVMVPEGQAPLEAHRDAASHGSDRAVP